jgi:hypothetical protein
MIFQETSSGRTNQNSQNAEYSIMNIWATENPERVRQVRPIVPKPDFQ